MKLALHIGTARTGTTSFQAWCAANRAALGEQGICYPLTPGAENHRKLMAYAIDTGKADSGLNRFAVKTLDDHERFRSQMRSDLAREVEASRNAGHRIWLMSTEHLHSKITTTAMMARLHALLKPHFDQITVYIHLRPQVDLLLSNATQRARSGRAVTRAELTRPSVSANSSYFNYNKIVGYWEDVFGAQNIALVPYRSHPDITAVMIDRLQIDAGPLTKPERLNRGLDWRSIQLANAVQAGFAALDLADLPDLHLDDLPGHDRVQLGRALAEEVQGRFDASNGKLAKRRSDITLEELNPDWSQHDEAGNIHLVEAPCLYGLQLAQMVRRLAQDRAMERWRRFITEGRIAALTGDVTALEKAKQKAQEAAAQLDALGYAVGDDPGLAGEAAAETDEPQS